MIISVAVASSALGYAAPPAEPSSLNLNSATALSWSMSADALAYNLYRGDVSSLSGGSYGDCQDGNLESLATTDAEKPIPGQAYFYLVSAMNEDGESAAGHDSSGAAHPPATRCIVARRLFRLTENGVASDGVSDGSSRRTGTAYVTMLRISRDSRARVQIKSTTGEVEAESIDLEHAARKPGDVSRFTRAYRSQVAYDGPLGAGWDFSDNMRLVRSGTDFVLIDGSGLRETFKATGAASFTAPPGLFGKLISDVLGGYTLRGKGIVRGVGGGMNPSRAAFFDLFGDYEPTAYVQDSSPNDEPRYIVQYNESDLARYALPPTRIDPTPARLGTNMTTERQGLVTDPGSDPPDIALPCHHDNMPSCGDKCPVCRGGSWRCEGCGFFDVFRTSGGSGSDNGNAGATSFELFFDRYETGRRYTHQYNESDLDFITRSWAPGTSNAPRDHGSGLASGRRKKGWLPANFRFERWQSDPYAEDGIRKDITINLRFDSRGRLTEAQDQFGDTTNYLYDKHGLLRTVVDTLGHARQYEYNLDGRITTLTDHTGRQVRYIYSGTGNGAQLVEVQHPAGGGLSPSRTLYSYSSGSADSRLNHNLLTITTAAQAAIGGPPTVQLSYGAPGTFQADRVTSMTVGGTNASGLPAGGTLHYAYSSLNAGADPSLVDLPRRRCLKTDPLGNETVFDTNAQLNLLTLVQRTNRELRPGEPDYTTELRWSTDGLIREIQFPALNRLLFTYDQPGADRYREGNLLEARSIADTQASGGRGDGHGAESHDLVWTYSYEPVFNQVASVTSPKGNDPSYLPPNGGVWSPARYTATRQFDYQEGSPASNGISALAAKFGIALGTFPLNVGDLNGDGRVDQARGLSVENNDLPVLLAAGSQQAAIEGSTTQPSKTLLRYNDFGQLISVTDPEGNVHQLVYYSERDPDGDGIPTPDPPDGRTLSAVDGGRRKFNLIDCFPQAFRNNHTNPTPACVRTDFQYDALGRLVRHVNGRGVATRLVWNPADMLTEVVHAAATADASGPLGDVATGRGETGLTPFAYRTRYQYDRDGNLLKLSLEDRDNTRGAGPFIETTMTYDILGGLRRISWPPVLGGSGLLSQLNYDANGNLIEVIGPAGDTLALEWDELDRLLSSTEGAGSPVSGRKGYEYYKSMSAFSQVTDELGRITSFEYDGHDRLVRSIDAVGGKREHYINHDSDLDGLIEWGRCGGPTPTDRSGSGNVKLSDTKLHHDERGRVFRIDRELFVPTGCPTTRAAEISDGGLTPGDNHVSTRYEHDRLGRLTFTTSDTLNTRRNDYDGLSRMRAGLDQAGATAVAYDAMFNPKEVTITKVSSAPGPPAQNYVTTYFYDALGRRTMSVSPTGETHRFVWNSASDLGAISDAKGPPGGTINRRSEGHETDTVAINGHGNVTTYSYDALGRRVKSEITLSASGQGDGTLAPTPDTSNPYNPDGRITQQNTYATSHLVQTLDDNLHHTTFLYDARNRVVRRTADDDTFTSYQYDAAGRLVSVTDPNGSVTNNSFDNLDRPIEVTYSRAPGIGGTTIRSYQYDGRSRLTRATDNNDPSVALDDSEVIRVYDSLGRELEDRQSLGSGGAAAITSRAWHGGLHTATTSPANRRTEYLHDASDRVIDVRETTTGLDVEYRYFGETQVHTMVTSTGLTSTALDDTGTNADGIDGEGRLTRWRQLSGSDLVAGFEYGYDRNGATTFERRLHDPSTTGELVGKRCEYDSAGRLSHSFEGSVDALGNMSGPPTDDRAYTRNGEGLWNSVTRNGTTYQSTPNNLDEYDENQSGGTRFDDGVADDFLDPVNAVPDGWNLAHDKNGNETDAGPTSLQFDIDGRVVRATRDLDGWVVGQYAYDALGRRVRRETSQPGMAPTVTHYLYSGNQPIEERDASSAVIREYVLDSASGRALTQISSGGVYHLLRDAAGSVIGLLPGGSSFPSERMVYDAHGKPSYQTKDNTPKLDLTGAPIAESDFGVAEGLDGCRYDSEFGNRVAGSNQDWGGMYSCEGRSGENPLYEPRGMSGENPLYEPSGTSGANSLYDTNKDSAMGFPRNRRHWDGTLKGSGALNSKRSCGGGNGGSEPQASWSCGGADANGVVVCCNGFLWGTCCAKHIPPAYPGEPWTCQDFNLIWGWD
jgi:YD repeat-containing protein